MNKVLPQTARSVPPLLYNPALLLCVVLVVTLIPYRHLWQAGLIIADDFEEVERALNIDIPHPEAIFLTAHEGTRYRPIHRALNMVTALVASEQARVYLFRNLALHMLNVSLLFWLVWMLLNSSVAAAMAAALFALHPTNINAVSVAVFTQTLPTAMLLLGLGLFIRYIQTSNRAFDWRPIIAALLFVGVIFSSEMYLWVGPIYILALASSYYWYGRRKNDLIALSITLCGLILFFIARQLVVEVTSLYASSSDPRYGLRTPLGVARNIGMFLIASGVMSDYLYAIDPMTQTIPTKLQELFSPNLALSIGSALLISLATVVGAAFGLRRAASRHMHVAVIFVLLFFSSIAVVSLMTNVSETHTYTANALLIIAQALLVWELVTVLRSSGRSIPLYILVVFAFFVLVSRGVGVDYRNAILVHKLQWVSGVQEHIRQNAQGVDEGTLVFVMACDVPAGYSVYGMNRLDLLSTQPFIAMTLDKENLQAETISLQQFAGVGSTMDPLQRFILVDTDGDMYATTDKNIKPSCQQ